MLLQKPDGKAHRILKVRVCLRVLHLLVPADRRVAPAPGEPFAQRGLEVVTGVAAVLGTARRVG